MNINKILTAIAWFLSFVAIILCVVVYFDIKKHKSDMEIYVGEPVIETQVITKAQIWLEDLNPNQKTDKKIAIWLDSQDPTTMVNVELNYDSSLLLAIDSNKKEKGSQIQMGQAPMYLLNQIDKSNRKIQLITKFPKPYTGKVLLGIMELIKINPKEITNLEFSYFPGSLGGTYALDINNKNILAKPNSLSL